MTNEPIHILIVDDDDLARLEIAHSIERQGHTVSQAQNGTQALGMLRAEEFDIVLLDLLMPEVDGFEVLQQIKADIKLSAIPVIVITSVGDSESAERSKGLGAIDYFTKPVDHQQLTHRISSVLSGTE
jgi:adenylate cyclase